MNFLNSLSLVYRFALLIACVVTGFAVYGLWSFKTLNELKITGPTYRQIVQGKDLVADILPPPEYIIESYLVGLQLAGGKHDRTDLVQRLHKLRAEYNARHDFWTRSNLNDQLRETFLNQAHQPALRFYDIAFGEFIPALHNGDSETATSALAKMEAAYESHRAGIDRVVQIANLRVTEDEAAANRQIGAATTLLWTVLALTLAVTIAVALTISRSVTRPLAEMQKMMLQIKNDRDFTLRLDTGGRDEIAETAATFNGLIGSLQQMLKELLEDADELAQAAQLLAATSAQTVVGSRQQSGAATSIATTIDQVNANVSQLSDNAQVALDISCKSGDLSHQGGDIIHNAAAAMLQIAASVQKTSGTIEALGQQSQQISSVVQVIKAVADQTNLLALNAAIEAARAGEQGRGFAVVADEVRNLAKRTTNATEEISQMIASMQKSTQLAISAMTDAVGKADDGAVIARRAGDAINEIKQESSKVVEVVNNISAALLDQNSASNDIADNIEQVAKMAKASNTAAEQTADEAKHLEKLAGHMRATAGKFKL
ncbi:methyl-accepting chemotaxis protein [Methylomonas sp. SURF-2]|uniref:Methyl-accepting chemotaxis protein n=1 Tax=Methylomonas subterranea TaxID=2952225 RepID=A0ABT1TKM0_9GAMM|nr:methyl-accepting chemotaxis protein [Methylomonas sp. SURF-2]MCQ8105632.1 methyl-accepting chemotaxis protein [Methylomonas sp. SURF-2]